MGRSTMGDYDYGFNRGRTHTVVAGSSFLSSSLVLLQAVFLTLKLCNVVSWEWVYVLIPAIVLGGLLALDILFFFVVFAIWFFGGR